MIPSTAPPPAQGNGGPPATWAARPVRASTPTVKAFEQDPACVNIIEVDHSAGRIERAFLRAVNIAPYNLTRHDEPLMVMEKIYRDYRARS
jgi:hypothetical protein